MISHYIPTSVTRPSLR